MYDLLNDLLSNQPETLSSALIYIVVFAIAGVTFIPIPLIALFASMTFDLEVALPLCYFGALVAAGSGYSLGCIVPIESLPKWMQKHAMTLRKTLIRGGLPIFIAIRFAPTPPFSLSSIVSGSMRARLGPFLCGSVLGIAPLVTLAAVLGWQAIELIKSPTYLAGSIVAAALVLFAVYKWVISRRNSKNSTL